MRNRTTVIACGTAILLSAVWALTLSAGPLDPPPGPIAATGPTQINQQYATSFPIVIDQSGSYILTSNITNTTPADGIHIDADHVFLNLNGFTISGADISTTPNRRGINVLDGHTNVRITNGSLTGWKGAGSDGLIASGTGTIIIENVASVRNTSGFALQMKAILRQCTCIANNASGFKNSGEAVYYECTATDSINAGFQSTFNARYIDCHTINNAIGFHLANGDAAISRCTSRGDASPFQQDGGSMFRGLLATDNLAF